MGRLTVAKFGNSVIGPDASALREVAARIAGLARGSRVVAVLSAPPTPAGGRTRSLTDVATSCGEAAAAGSGPDPSPVRRAWAAAVGRLGPAARASCEGAVAAHMAEFDAALADAARAGAFADAVRARALAHSGELPMSAVAAAAVREEGLRAAAVGYGSWPIITDDNYESANFVREASMAARGPMAALVRENDVVAIGGFVGRSPSGAPTTYERGGSDRTAVDIGILFGGDYDVTVDLEKDGPVASADPRVADSTEEVAELSHNERYLRRFDPLCSVTHGRGVVTLIGDGMHRAQHVVARTGACIGEAGLNILNMDAQEETSRIIVIVEDAGGAVERAVRAIHARRGEMA